MRATKVYVLGISIKLITDIYSLFSVHPLRTDVQLDIMDSFVLIDVGIRGTGKVVKALAAAFQRCVITLKDAHTCVRHYNTK